jgi:nucleotide-binding universal stress UspA family protein
MTKDAFPRHLLFATDFTARCDRAQDRAVQLAVQWNARLTVIHALEPHATASDAPHDGIPTLIACEAQRLREELATVEGLVAHVFVRHGTLQDVLSEMLSRDPAGVIVAGISRNDSLGRAILGSTTATLIKTSGIPVLVVKRRPIDTGGQTVFASDLSANSAMTLKLALASFPPPSVLFHAFDPPFATLAENRMNYVVRFRAESAARCRRFLDETLGPETAGAIEIVAEAGEPASALAAYVIENDVDLVIAGTEARTGVMGAILGSVAAHILDEVPCDVLVLPAPRPS